MPRGGPKRAAAVKALAKSQQNDSDKEESEWEQDEEEQSQSSSQAHYADKQDSSLERKDSKPPAKKKKQKKSTTKKRKMSMDSSQDYSSSNNDEEDDLLPSYARKTAKGGYAHTTSSRARISKANKGNTPWNKGKNRSAGTKAKIAAGVRARNRKLLLEKLKSLNLTEDEWLAKKKEIKYLRERIRKAKKAAQAKEAQKQRKGKDADKTYEELELELSAKLQQQVQAIQTVESNVKTSTATLSSNKKKTKKKPSVVNENAKEELLQKVFTPHVTWTRHDYDLQDGLYQQLCPTGGPGGLACCDVCCNAYSNFLNQTSHDLDVQATHNAATEVQECLEFIQDTRNVLEKKMKKARTQPVPLKQASVEPVGVPTASV